MLVSTIASFELDSSLVLFGRPLLLLLELSPAAALVDLLLVDGAQVGSRPRDVLRPQVLRGHVLLQLPLVPLVDDHGQTPVRRPLKRLGLLPRAPLLRVGVAVGI